MTSNDSLVATKKDNFTMSVGRLEILQVYCLIDIFLQVADEPSLRNNRQPDLEAKASFKTLAEQS